MIAEGDTVMFRGTSSGTQGGEFMGVAPAGKRVAVSGDPMIPQLQPKTIQVNSTKLAYVEQGTSDAVVLVHGGLVDFRSWMFQIEPFVQRYRVNSYSRRYHFP